MNNSKVLFQDFTSRLGSAEDPDEAHAIGLLVFEHLYGLSRTAIMAGQIVDDPQAQRLDTILDRLRAHEPLQYILGEAHFFGRTYRVDPAVLIPRPETEELVQQVVDFAGDTRQAPFSILDIGTGSGCIPITLALGILQAHVYATDISPAALAVARENATRLQAAVTFFEHDILTQPLPVESLDVVVSNPPYITLREKTSMKTNVLEYEPHLALFVADDDPLLFYKVISQKARTGLRPGGMLAFEINAEFGREVADLLRASGFTGIAIVNDLQGKQRIVKGFLA